MKKIILQQLRNLRGNTLVVNAFFLMLSTLVVAVTGFVFWIVVAHAYPTPAVGIATTLLSVSNLIALLGLAGFDTTFVRFLPHAKNKNTYINSGFIVTFGLSCGIAALVATVLPFWSTSLGLLHQPLVWCLFIFFTAVTALNTLTNAVFLAFKKARFIFVINTIFSVGKVALPFAWHGKSALVIFTLVGVAQLIGLILSLMWLHRECNYSFMAVIDRHALREVRRFSFTMYAASIFNLLPPTIVPLLIVHALDSRQAAYYYMAFTIASVLYTIAYSSMQSVFAEGSHNAQALRSHVGKAAKFIAISLMPAALLAGILSRPLLVVFGHEYAEQASSLLQWFAASAMLVAAYSAFGAIFKVTKNLIGMLSMNIVYAGTIIGVCAWLLPSYGLKAVGAAWLSGNLTACAIGAAFWRNKKRGWIHGTATDSGQ